MIVTGKLLSTTATEFIFTSPMFNSIQGMNWEMTITFFFVGLEPVMMEFSHN